LEVPAASQKAVRDQQRDNQIRGFHHSALRHYSTSKPDAKFPRASRLQYSRMDRDTMDFFQALFDSFRREMHQEFENLFARLDSIRARPEPQGDRECEPWKAIEAWAARPNISTRNERQADI
jgi:hypothetical protein